MNYQIKVAIVMEKCIHVCFSKYLVHSGLIHLMSNLWTGVYKKSTLEVIQELTQNKDLQTIFTYCWGDYGCSPKESHFIMQVSLKKDVKVL